MELNLNMEESKTLSTESGVVKSVVLTAITTPEEYKALVSASSPDGTIKVTVKK